MVMRFLILYILLLSVFSINKWSTCLRGKKDGCSDEGDSECRQIVCNISTYCCENWKLSCAALASEHCSVEDYECNGSRDSATNCGGLEHGVCVPLSSQEIQGVCSCNNRWQGDTCETCPGNFDPDEGCQDGICINGFEGENCDTCATYWHEVDGVCQCYLTNPNSDCTGCASAYFDIDSNCSECMYYYTGDDCKTCPDGYDDSCQTCTIYGMDPDKSCTSCRDNFEEPDCAQCSGKFYGEYCLSCPEGMNKDTGCVECMTDYHDPETCCQTCLNTKKDPSQDCTVCIGYWEDQENCTNCYSNFNEECTECLGGWDIEFKCQKCLDGHVCEGCDTTIFTENCNECLNENKDFSTGCTTCLGNYDIEQDCQYCMNEYYGVNCLSCNPLYNDDCSGCSNELLEFPDCTECINGKTPPECENKYPNCKNVDEEEGVCLQCASYWLGSNCDECLPNFNSECSGCVNEYLNFESLCKKCSNKNRDYSTLCLECKEGWDINDDCLSCEGNFDPETNCTECLPNFYGDDCIGCDPEIFYPNCSACLNPKKAFPGCTECINYYTLTSDCIECPANFNDDCSACLNENFDLSDMCQSCYDGFDINTDCVSCLPGFIGEECDSCDEKIFTDYCTACVNDHYSFESTCTECSGYWTGENCDVCSLANGNKDCTNCSNHYDLSTNCVECQPNFNITSDCSICINNFYGENCLSCDDNYDSECLYCLEGYDPSTGCSSCYGFWEGTDCKDCNYTLFNDDCSGCRNENYDPSSGCTTCLSNYNILDNCQSCKDYWYGDNCVSCPKHFNLACTKCIGNFLLTSNCTTCVPHWEGENCDECPDDPDAITCNPINTPATITASDLKVTELVDTNDYPSVTLQIKISDIDNEANEYTVVIENEEVLFFYKGVTYEKSISFFGLRETINANLEYVEIGPLNIHHNGKETVSITVTDHPGELIGEDELTIISSFVLDITSVNTCPVITLEETTVEIKRPLSMSMSILSFFDYDDEGGELLLNISSRTGLGFFVYTGNSSLEVMGNGEEKMQLTGTKDTFDYFLQNNDIMYYPTKELVGLTDYIDIVVSDKGNTGAGGALKAFEVVTINVKNRDLFGTWSETDRNRIEMFENTKYYPSDAYFTGLEIIVPDIEDNELVSLTISFDIGTTDLPETVEINSYELNQLVITGNLSSINEYLSNFHYLPDEGVYGAYTITFVPSVYQPLWDKTIKGEKLTVPVVIIKIEDKVEVKETYTSNGVSTINIASIQMQAESTSSYIKDDMNNEYSLELKCRKCKYLYEGTFYLYEFSLNMKRSELGSVLNSLQILSYKDHYNALFDGSDYVRVTISDKKDKSFSIESEFEFYVISVNTPPEIYAEELYFTIVEPLYQQIFEKALIVDYDDESRDLKLTLSCTDCLFKDSNNEFFEKTLIMEYDKETLNKLMKKVYFYPNFVENIFTDNVTITVEELNIISNPEPYTISKTLYATTNPRSLVPSFVNRSSLETRIEMKENSGYYYTGLKIDCAELLEDELMYFEVKCTGGNIVFADEKDSIKILERTSKIVEHEIFHEFTENYVLVEGTLNDLNNYISTIFYSPDENKFTNSELGDFEITFSIYTEQEEWNKKWRGEDFKVEVAVNSLSNAPRFFNCYSEQVLLIEGQETKIMLEPYQVDRNAELTMEVYGNFSEYIEINGEIRSTSRVFLSDIHTFTVKASYSGYLEMYAILFSQNETKECPLSFKIMPQGGENVTYKCIDKIDEKIPYYTRLCSNEICSVNMFSTIESGYCQCIGSFSGEFCRDLSLGEDGVISSYISGKYGSTGLFQEDKNRREVKEIDIDMKPSLTPSLICSSSYFDLMVSSNNLLYIRGNDEYIEYLENQDKDNFILVDFDEKYETEYVGYEITTSEGDYVWKIDSSEINVIPKKIECLERTAFVLTQNGYLYAIGNPTNYELNQLFGKFRKIKEGVNDIYSSYHTIYAVLETSIDLYYCNDTTVPESDYTCPSEHIQQIQALSVQATGYNHYGCLGINEEFESGSYHTSGEFKEINYDFIAQNSQSSIPLDHTQNLATYKHDPSKFNRVYPKIYAFEHGCIIEYTLDDEDVIFQVGRDHISLMENTIKFTEVDLRESDSSFLTINNFDYVDRIYGGALYIVSLGHIYISGSVENGCQNCGFSGYDEYETVELTTSQYGDYNPDESGKIYQFLCTDACYIMTENGVFTIGKSDKFGCNNDYCETITQISSDEITLENGDIISYVIPGYENSVEGGFGAIYLVRPDEYRIYDSENTNTGPLFDYEHSKLENNQFSIVLYKENSWISLYPLIKFQKYDDVVSDWVDVSSNGYGYCTFPFFSEKVVSSWDYWYQKDGALDIFSLNDTWGNVKSNCGFVYESNELYDVYSNRMVITERFYQGNYYERETQETEEYTYDIEVKFPKIIIVSSVNISNEFKDWLSVSITSKTFDRETRKGTISFGAVMKRPNFLVFSDIASSKVFEEYQHTESNETLETKERITTDDENIIKSELSVVENGGDSNPDSRVSTDLQCSNDYCYQEFVLSFSVVENYTVTSIDTEFIVNFVQYCNLNDTDDSYLSSSVSPNGGKMNENCINPSEQIPATFSLQMNNLGDGSFVEEVNMDTTLEVYDSKDFENLVDVESNVFKIDDWVYLQGKVETDEDISISSVEVNSVVLSSKYLYENSEITDDGISSNFNLIDTESNSIAFSFKITDLVSSSDNSNIYSIMVYLDINYEGNEKRRSIFSSNYYTTGGSIYLTIDTSVEVEETQDVGVIVALSFTSLAMLVFLAIMVSLIIVYSVFIVVKRKKKSLEKKNQMDVELKEVGELKDIELNDVELKEM